MSALVSQVKKTVVLIMVLDGKHPLKSIIVCVLDTFIFCRHPLWREVVSGGGPAGSSLVLLWTGSWFYLVSEGRGVPFLRFCPQTPTAGEQPHVCSHTTKNIPNADTAPQHPD